MKAILKDILGEYNNWSISPKEINLNISANTLTSTKNILKSLKFQVNPNLNSLIDPSYTIPMYPDGFSELGELVDNKSRPDLIFFRNDTLLLIEIKTRLFNKVQKDIWDKLTIKEKNFFDHFFIRYHFDNPYWALNAYRDLIIFKENIRKTVKDRISETYDKIKSNSCEMFRTCCCLSEQENLKKISNISSITEESLKKVKNRIGIVAVPFYITMEQEKTLINCLKRLQVFCDKHLKQRIHLQYWKINPVDISSIINKGDPFKFKITTLSIEENIKKFQIFDNKEYEVNYTEFQMKYNLISDKTLWKECNKCVYFKKYCQTKLI
jgi:hypothetical protein